jgi:hypothetical protein
MPESLKVITMGSNARETVTENRRSWLASPAVFIGHLLEAGSMDRRNTRVENIRWGLPVKSLSRSGI